MLSPPALRVLLVDDHFVVRMGLAAALQSEAGLEIIGEAGSGRQALALLRTTPADIVLMDWRLPDQTGAEAAQAIRAEFPETKVIIVSAYDGKEDIAVAVEAGVDGYLTKSTERQEIIQAIFAVHAGETYFPPAIAAKMAIRMRREPLSDREREVLIEIVKGRSNKEIATALGIAPGTVKLHVVHLLSKLGVRDRTQAAGVAIQRGLVRLE